MSAVSILVSLGLFLATAAPEDFAGRRAELFGDLGGEVPAAARSARLVLLFHPDLTTCQPQEAVAVRALQALAEQKDVVVFTVTPRSLPAVESRYGEKLPGVAWPVEDEAWRRDGAFGPRPRLEVWSHDGALLLWKSLPAALDEESLRDEIRATLSFTAPRSP